MTSRTATTPRREDRPAVFDTIAVVGGGSWGTALALTAWRAGRRVRLWAREEHVVEAVARERRNPFLPNADIPEDVVVTNLLEEALAGADLVVLVTPSQHLRAVARQVEPLVGPDVPVVVCAKGIERETGLLMGEVLSGPTFAGEVAADMATGVTVAAAEDGFHDRHLAARVAQTAAGGGRTVDIRLDPPELGRVQVRLEMGADNSVRAMLSAERADTLAELQRTARDLEKALEEAGLDLAENGLEFSLSQGGEQAFEDQPGRFRPVFAGAETLIETQDAPSGPPTAPNLYGFALSERARLDMRI